MSAEENKALVRRFYEEFFNKGNLAVADELVVTDYVFHRATGPDINGPEGYKQLVSAVLNAFPDFHVTIEDIVAEGDKVVTRYTLSGTHKGEFRDIPPTGKKWTVWGICIECIVGGKIVETWERYDTLGFMQQLGVIQG